MQESIAPITTEEIISKRLVQLNNEFPKLYTEGLLLCQKEACEVLAYSNTIYDLFITEKKLRFSFFIEGEEVFLDADGGVVEWTSEYIAGLLHLKDNFLPSHKNRFSDHKTYSREGMIARVLEERNLKAEKENYRFQWADNIHGDHVVFSPTGSKYKVFLRDFVQQIGYSDSPDARLNKLGTSKHIMAAFKYLEAHPEVANKLSNEYPFVEVFLDPLHDYRITWHYPYDLPSEIIALFDTFFGDLAFIPKGAEKDFVPFIEQAEVFDTIVVRPEVNDLLDKICRQESMKWVNDHYEIPYDKINATLFPYQQKGVEFITYKEGCILADEMGLGKTLQAITSAVAKKEIFGFRKTLIICPASLKDQWKREIEKFTDEKAINVTGSPEERAEIYQKGEAYFFIVNYETVLRDSRAINAAGFDFLILDEAQRIKNFETKTANAVKRITKNHILVLTGTPIENRLTDLFSIMQAIDHEFLGPLWEFSYQYCLFDHHLPNKINGYYDLHKLKEKLKPVLLRREKKDVLKELPQVSMQDVKVSLAPLQQEYHSGYARGLSQIIHKKFKTPMDFTKMQQLLAAMRMVCNSTYLIDEEEPYESPKIDELEHILIEKLDILNSDRKIIIFSEWLKSQYLIGKMLKKYDLKYVAFSGKIPVKKRGEYIKKFEEDKDCKFFLSTESGGAGLNLQVADTLINFELPWNPAKKNQRIGRIDRLGQQNTHLTVINFITFDSIEMRIASGLMLKENLFEGVLNNSNDIQTVDFSEKGRAQFLEELAKMTDEFIMDDASKEDIAKTEENIEDETEALTLQNETPESKSPNETDLSQKEAEDQKNNTPSSPAEPSPAQLEEVLQQGMGFFSGLYQMATGATMDAQDQKINVDQETGEVTMKFKLPGFK